jgi:NAD(P)H-flavin reductase
MSLNPYKCVPARLERIVDETPTIRTLFLAPARPVPFLAGQFIELAVPGIGEAPFTPSSSPAVRDRMEVTIMRVGRVTEALHALEPGAEVGIRGPLGRPYPLQDFYGKEILVVGGGVGLAPLRALLFALFEEQDKFGRIVLRYGARTPDDIVYREAVSKAWDRNGSLDVMLTVDQGDPSWSGHVGVVTTILEEDGLTCDTANGVAVVCGPPIMMKFTTLALLKRGYPPDRVYLSMEKHMSCGIGKCGHCRLGPHYACRDGPVFTYAQVQDAARIWD